MPATNAQTPVIGILSVLGCIEGQAGSLTLILTPSRGALNADGQK
jgi:hypothetical protein